MALTRDTATLAGGEKMHGYIGSFLESVIMPFLAANSD